MSRLGARKRQESRRELSLKLNLKQTGTRRGAGGRALDVLQLGLQILNRFVELGNAGLELIDGIVEGLHLAGDRIQLAAARFGLRIDLLLQGVNGNRHLVGGVRCLLDLMLQDAEFGVHGGLQSLHHGREVAAPGFATR